MEDRKYNFKSVEQYESHRKSIDEAITKDANNEKNIKRILQCINEAHEIFHCVNLDNDKKYDEESFVNLLNSCVSITKDVVGDDFVKRNYPKHLAMVYK